MIAKSHDPERAAQLFLELCDLSPAEQQSRLALLGENEQGLRQKVAKLLSSDRSTQPLFDHPATLIGDLAVRRRLPVADPKFIHRYPVLGRIGEGGMSVVYEAEQPDTLRHVAIKVLATRLGDARSTERFRYETRVLASLDHPDIAQIFEAGTEEIDGDQRPFFVMQLVKGRPLHTFVHEEKVDVHGRVRLLARIAHAVHHAHQKGVVHRDLKPGNILVDADGNPKVLDFGVACPAVHDGSSDSMSVFPERVGTLQYMSPEQLSPADAIDIRSDVYSLGVIGYELLAGRAPYEIDETDLEKTASIIQTQKPAPMSFEDRLHSADLEAIIQKTLEKSPGHRYESAAAFATDLERCLGSYPVTARRAGRAEQLRLFTRRNRALSVAALLVVLALVSGLVGTSWQRSIAIEEARRAEEQADRATQANALAAFRNARLFAQRGRWKEALAAFDEADRSGYPDKIELILGRVDAWDGSLENDKVRQELETLFQLPDLGKHRAEALLLRALFHFRSQSGQESSWAKGLPLMQEALDESARGASALCPSHSAMARAFLADDLGSMRDLLIEALTLDPNSRRARLAFIPLLLLLGEIEESLQQSRILQSLFPEDPTGILLEGIAMTFIGGGEPRLNACAEKLERRGFGPAAALLRTLDTLTPKLRVFDQIWADSLAATAEEVAQDGSSESFWRDLLPVAMTVGSLLESTRSTSSTDRTIDAQFTVSPALSRIFQKAAQIFLWMPVKSALAGSEGIPAEDFERQLDELVEIHPIGVWYFLRGVFHLIGQRYLEAELDFKQCRERASPVRMVKAPILAMLEAQAGQFRSVRDTQQKLRTGSRRRGLKTLDEAMILQDLRPHELRFLCTQAKALEDLDRAYWLALRWSRAQESADSVATLADIELQIDALGLARRHAEKALDLDTSCELAHEVLYKLDKAEEGR